MKTTLSFSPYVVACSPVLVGGHVPNEVGTVYIYTLKSPRATFF